MLTKHEQETIINFNQGDDRAYIFTYSQAWQSHLEKKLGLKAVRVNSFGGKDYELPKSFIRLPRGPNTLSAERKTRLQDRGRELQVILSKKRQEKSDGRKRTGRGEDLAKQQQYSQENSLQGQPVAAPVQQGVML